MAHTVVPMSVFGDEGWRVADRDEFLRPETTLEGLAALRTPFRVGGRVTAGNSAGLTDGATAGLLAAESVAAELGLEPSMRLVAFAYTGVEPAPDGDRPRLGDASACSPRPASTIDDIGLFELNEPFAVQVLTWCDGVGVQPDDPRLNPSGGAIACGHPLAATGVRLMSQLAFELERRPDVRYGLDRALHRPRHGRRDPLGEHAPWLTAPDAVLPPARSRRASARSRSSRSTTARTGRSRTSSAGPRSHRSPGSCRSSQEGDWRGLVLTGKPFVFAVGADLTEFPQMSTPELARAAAKAGHDAFAAIRDLPYPTLAAINGAALGGGLEIALHCDFRTLARSVRHIGFPEVFLGIIPGWGGTQLAPRLVGAAAAVELIVTNPLKQNRMLAGRPGGRARARRRAARRRRVPRRLDRVARARDRGAARAASWPPTSPTRRRSAPRRATPSTTPCTASRSPPTVPST